MNEVIFLVEDAPEGGYTARALGHSIFTEGDSMDALRNQIRDEVGLSNHPPDRHRGTHGGRMSYEELREYLRKLRAPTELGDVRIEWSVTRPEQIQAMNHDKLMGIQIADVVASSFYFAVHQSPLSFTKPRYAQQAETAAESDALLHDLLDRAFKGEL